MLYLLLTLTSSLQVHVWSALELKVEMLHLCLIYVLQPFSPVITAVKWLGVFSQINDALAAD